jgi:hypothetical protein
VTILCATGATAAARGGETGLRAGAAAVTITPLLDRTVYLAGFDENRRATGVHDDLYARVLVLEKDGMRMALVGLDLIGLPYHRARAITARVRSVPADRIVLACTHVHSGPDTIGLWGPSQTQSGRDEQYLKRLEERVAGAIDQAAAELKPATVHFAQATVPDGLVYNSRDRALQDKTLTALQCRVRGRTPSSEQQRLLRGDPSRSDGQTIATLVNYASHPEVMQNGSNDLTADFCGVTMREVERAFGGVGVYLNGALGGMVTPEAQKNRWDEVHRVGAGIAKAAIDALKTAPPVDIHRLEMQTREVEIPLENPRFRLALAVGLLEPAWLRRPVPGPPVPPAEAAGAAGSPPAVENSPLSTDARITTAVSRILLGDAEIVTVPGELLPGPGLELRAAMRGRYRFLIGLGHDELGYILDPADFDRDLYRYERSMSVGKQAWPRIFTALKDLMR